MLKGVDISNWQAGIDVKALSVDFILVKASEGVSFVDKQCNGFIEQAKASGKLWGFYHFARENEPEKEAEFFHKHTAGYSGDGIPVLDYEVSNYNNAKWCERFIQHYYDLTGVWCMLYISASRCPQYRGSWIPKKCGLWVAGYPHRYNTWTNDKLPYKISPWSVAAIWQFTDALKLSAYSGNLDGNYAYMTRDAWASYAGKADAIKPAHKSCEDLAQEVLQGKWGNGWNRQQALVAAYDPETYQHVQAIVNRLSK